MDNFKRVVTEVDLVKNYLVMKHNKKHGYIKKSLKEEGYLAGVGGKTNQNALYTCMKSSKTKLNKRQIKI